MRSSETGCAAVCGTSCGARRSNRMRTGHDYVLIGRRAALKVPFARIAEEFEGALRRMHAGRNGNTGSR